MTATKTRRELRQLLAEQERAKVMFARLCERLLGSAEASAEIGMTWKKSGDGKAVHFSCFGRHRSLAGAFDLQDAVAYVYLTGGEPATAFVQKEWHVLETDDGRRFDVADEDGLGRFHDFLASCVVSA